MEVIQVPGRPASRRFYTVAGRLLFVESFDLELSNLIERLFSGWQLTPVSSSDRSPDIRLNFFCRATAPEIPSNLKQFEIAEGGACFTEGDDYYLTFDGAVVHLRNGSPVVVDVWMKELPASGAPLLPRVTSFAVCAALRRYGLFELHSAGVVHPRNNRGVLIVGPSGSGKSTLALQLAAAGWSYLSDDELLLSLVDDSVEARGFRSFFAVSGATASAAGLRGFDAHDGQYKTCFEPEAVFTSQRTLQVPAGVLLFTHLGGEQSTRVEKLTQAESMTRLLRACPWATYDTAIAGANLGLLSRLARQASAYDLVAGHDLLEPGYAAKFLSDNVEA